MKNIFIQQIVFNNEILGQRMYSKDGYLIYDFNEDIDFKLKVKQLELEYFTSNFFNRRCNSPEGNLEIENGFFQKIITENVSSWVCDDEERIISCMYGLFRVNIEYNRANLPMKVFNNEVGFMHQYRYDDDGNLICFDDGNDNIYRYQYVYYQDIYDILDVQFLNY